MAERALHDEPTLFRGDVWVACATGDVNVIRDAIDADANWVNERGGPLAMPPLIAVTHSRLIADPEREPKLLACARLLLECGRERRQRLDQSRVARWHAVRALRRRGDHAQRRDDHAPPRRRREPRRQRIALPFRRVPRLDVHTTPARRRRARKRHQRARSRARLRQARRSTLNARARGDANERPWVHHAILRGRSIDHVRALFNAGADLRRTNEHGVSLFRFAQAFGRADIVELLRAAGVDEPLNDSELFLSACARGDEPAARAMLAQIPDVVQRLTPRELQ